MGIDLMLGNGLGFLPHKEHPHTWVVHTCHGPFCGRPVG